VDREFTILKRPVRLVLEAQGDSTRMRWTWDIIPAGVMKFLTPLVGWMGRRQEARIWSELKRVLESTR
jgi:hypothetical protein